MARLRNSQLKELKLPMPDKLRAWLTEAPFLTRGGLSRMSDRWYALHDQWVTDKIRPRTVKPNAKGRRVRSTRQNIWRSSTDFERHHEYLKLLRDSIERRRLAGWRRHQAEMNRNFKSGVLRRGNNYRYRGTKMWMN